MKLNATFVTEFRKCENNIAQKQSEKADEE